MHVYINVLNYIYIAVAMIEEAILFYYIGYAFTCNFNLLQNALQMNYHIHGE